jgi:hypothetical protein
MLNSDFFVKNKGLILFFIIAIVVVIIMLSMRKSSKEGFIMENTEIYQPALKKNMTHFDNSVMLGIKDITENYNRAFLLKKEVDDLAKKEFVLNKLQDVVKVLELSQNALLINAQTRDQRKQKFYTMLYVMFGIRDLSDLKRVKFYFCKDPFGIDECQDMNELTITIKSSVSNPQVLEMQLWHQGCKQAVIVKKSELNENGEIVDKRYLKPTLDNYNKLTNQNLVFPTKVKCKGSDINISYNELFFEYHINTNEEIYKLYDGQLCYENNIKFINYDTPYVQNNIDEVPESEDLAEIVTNFYNISLPLKLDMVYKFRNRTDMPVIEDMKELAHQEITTSTGTEYNLFVADKNLLIKTVKNPFRVLTNKMVNDYLGFSLTFPHVCNIEGELLKDISELQNAKRITYNQVKEKLHWVDHDDAFSFVQTRYTE